MSSQSYAIDQYTKEGPSVQERIEHGSTSKALKEREATMQKVLGELGKRMSNTTPVVPIRDKMTEALESL